MRLAAACACLALAAPALGEERFDVSQFEKKSWELGGFLQGTAERQKALELVDRCRGRRRRRITLGADKAYDVTPFVHELRARSVTPHIAIDGHLSKTGKQRKTAVDGRTTRHAGYDISQRCRKRIEEVFGWIKSSAGLATLTSLVPRTAIAFNPLSPITAPMPPRLALERPCSMEA